MLQFWRNSYTAIKTTVTFLLLVCIVSYSLPLAASFEPIMKKKVLILYSYSADNQVMLTKSFQEEMTKYVGDNVEYLYEYLDLSRFPMATNKDNLMLYLRNKYTEKQPDMILAAYEPAANFLLSGGAEIFPGVPAVLALFEGENEVNTQQVPDNYRKVIGTLGTSKSVEIILALQPNVKKIYVVAGTSQRERRTLTAFSQSIAAFAERVEFIYLDKLAVDDMAATVQNLGTDSAILYFYVFKDSAGNNYTPFEAFHKLHAAASVPIYTTSSSYLDLGTIGGYLISNELFGGKLAAVAADILHGNIMLHAPQQNALAAECMFDWRELQRWGIDESKLPPGSIVKFKTPSVWDMYKRQIISALCLIVLQTLLITILLINRSLRLKAQNALEIKEKDLQKSHAELTATYEELNATYEELNASYEELEANEEELRSLYAEILTANRSLAESHQTISDIFNAANDAIMVIDPESGEIIKHNEKAAALFGYSYGEFKEHGIEAIAVGKKEDTLQHICKSMEQGTQLYEMETVDKKGRYLVLELNAAQAKVDGKPHCLAVIRDITKRKQMEEQLIFLTLHDPLTGIYNRTFFEEQIRNGDHHRNKGLGLFMCDVDGLKLINDTLGHRQGDELLKNTASILNDGIKLPDFAARIGGDEFAVVIFNPEQERLEILDKKYRDAVNVYNQSNPHLPLSVSIGWAAGSTGISIDTLIKEADKNMYRQKIHQQQSARSSLVKTMMTALAARDYITEGHAERLADLIEIMGRELRLPASAAADLKLFANFHDIGKVGIPDNILNKPGKLSDEEMIIMKSHSEIGFRIARASAELEPIADWILKHHEYWNGTGYPYGLKGTEIPIECRLMAIVDAYDAMTNDRPYRKALNHQDALRELGRCSGTQFDPKLSELFISLISAEHVPKE